MLGGLCVHDLLLSSWTTRESQYHDTLVTLPQISYAVPMLCYSCHGNIPLPGRTHNKVVRLASEVGRLSTPGAKVLAHLARSLTPLELGRLAPLLPTEPVTYTHSPAMVSSMPGSLKSAVTVVWVIACCCTKPYQLGFVPRARRVGSSRAVDMQSVSDHAATIPTGSSNAACHAGAHKQACRVPAVRSPDRNSALTPNPLRRGRT